MLILVAACQFARPLDVQPDAGPDAPTDASIDARPDLVAGVVSLGFRTASGVTEQGVDISAATIRALIPDAAELSGYRAVDGIGRADGTFSIEGVPPDLDYVLRVGSRYYETRAHQVRLRSELPIRAGAASASMPTLVTIDVAGLPRGSGLEVALASSSVGVEGQPGYEGATGTRMVLDWSVDTFGTYELTGHPLPSVAAGDDLRFLIFQRTHPWRGVSFATIAGATEFVNPDLIDGQAQLLTGTLTSPAPSPLARSFGSRALFEDGHDPSTDIGEVSMSVHAVPVLGSRWTPAAVLPPGPAIAVATLDADQVSQGGPSLMGTFGDPFPAAWPRLEYVHYERRRWYRLPGRPPARVIGGTERVSIVSGSDPSRPPVAPPGAIAIDGRAGGLGGAVRFAGAPVTVTWSGVVGARQYHVSVVRLGASGARTNGSFITAGTRAVVPPELFSGAEFFVFEVTAFAGTNAYANGDLDPGGLPASLATTVTAPFRITATCGNGAVDPGEDCDTGGVETIGCDLDCSAPTCGDGVRNVTAGELCDSVVDAPGCDSDCTAVVCGDGHRNADVEDCDDGNTTADGNGCGVSCRFANLCGNGVREVLAEECDAGGESATCDSDCSLVVCGDYTVNTAAGEQCDDGNAAAGDGCSVTCRLE